jgi:hypothetical protein
MTNTGLRIYTTVIALICGGALAWSIHQSSVATAWQADARSWHGLAAQAVVHDRQTTLRMRTMVAEYDRLVVRTRKSQRKLLKAIARAQRVGAAAVAVPQSAAVTSIAAPASAPAPVAVPAAPAPTTHTTHTGG